MLKSAYEIAMEKTGGSGAKLSSKQKERIADVDSRCAAQIAEARIMFDEKLTAARGAGDAEAGRILSDQLAQEIARIETRRDREKEKIREGEH